MTYCSTTPSIRLSVVIPQDTAHAVFSVTFLDELVFIETEKYKSPKCELDLSVFRKTIYENTTCSVWNVTIKYNDIQGDSARMPPFQNSFLLTL
jgi:hypothetical protein